MNGWVLVEPEVSRTINDLASGKASYRVHSQQGTSMSFGIMPYAVALEEIEGVFGCKDIALAEIIKSEDSYWFGRTDYDEEELSPAQALDNIVAGNALNGFGDKYGFALEKICSHFGTVLPNGSAASIGLQGIEEFDVAIQAAGVPKAQFSLLEHLVFRGPPIPIPETDGNPSIGYFRAGELAVALAATALADEALLGSEDAFVFTEIKGWILECDRMKCDLICFSY